MPVISYFKNINSNQLYIVIVAFVYSMVLFFTNHRVDEGFHADQILRVLNGNELNPLVTTLPGYHYLIAFFIKVFQTESLIMMRIISTLISLCSLYLIYKIAEALQAEKPNNVVAEIFSNPIILPFFFLLYTDVVALLLVLVCYYFSLKQKYLLAGIFALLSCTVRQTNIIWVFFIFLLSFIELKEYNLDSLKKFIFKNSTFILTFILFIIFVKINKGIAVGDTSMHPPLKIKLGNPIFFLISLFIVLLPLQIANFYKIKSFLLSNKLYIPIFLLLIYLLYEHMRFDHPYNGIGGHIFLRNQLLYFAQKTDLNRLSFSIIAVYSLLSIIVTPLKKNSFYWLYPITFLLLASTWLVEQRYYIVTLVLFLLFKKEENTNTRITLLYNTVLSVILLVGIYYDTFFL
jgi:alpha-1,2-glucosyltransferase